MKKNNSLPGFLVVGAPKSGTTSLYHYLKGHPEIYLPDQKELHYFSYPELSRRTAGPGDAAVCRHLCDSLTAYGKHYEGNYDGRLAGDISPSYLHFSETSIPAIKQTLKDPKIIIMLRRHDEKAYSQYMHLVSEGRETLSFEEALEKENERMEAGFSDFWQYAGSTYYYEHVFQYLSIFGEENVHVILMEEFSKDPVGNFHSVLKFLGVDADYKPNSYSVHNMSGVPKSRMLARLISPGPVYSLLKSMIPSSIGAPIRAKLIRMNQNDKPVMSETTRTNLLEVFRADRKAIESLLQRKWY